MTALTPDPQQLFPITGDQPKIADSWETWDEKQFPPLYTVPDVIEGRSPKYIAIDIEKTGEFTSNPITHVGVALGDDRGPIIKFPLNLPFDLPSRDLLKPGFVDLTRWSKRCLVQFWSDPKKVPDDIYQRLASARKLPGCYYHAIEYVCKFIAHVLDSSKTELEFVGDNLLFDLGELNYFYRFFCGLPLPYSNTHGYHCYREVNSMLKMIPKGVWEPMAKQVAKEMEQDFKQLLYNSHMPDADAAYMLIKYSVALKLKNAVSHALEMDLVQRGPLFSFLCAAKTDVVALYDAQQHIVSEVAPLNKRKLEEELQTEGCPSAAIKRISLLRYTKEPPGTPPFVLTNELKDILIRDPAIPSVDPFPLELYEDQPATSKHQTLNSRSELPKRYSHSDLIEEEPTDTQMHHQPTSSNGEDNAETNAKEAESNNGLVTADDANDLYEEARKLSRKTSVLNAAD